MHSEQKQAIEEILNTDIPVMVTGSAGTGKSAVLRALVARLRGAGMWVAVAAPTGIAALNVDGVTLHALFGLKTRGILGPVGGFDKSGSSFFQRLEVLVIDEISMVRIDHMDSIDRALRFHRKNEEPFGGIKLVLFGDLYQLPPVVTVEDVRLNAASMRQWHEYGWYSHLYFTHSSAITKSGVRILELTHIHRQSGDIHFSQILQRLRVGQTRAEDLKVLNDVAMANDLDDRVVRLFGKNYDVDTHNWKKLLDLGSEIFHFEPKWNRNTTLAGTPVRAEDYSHDYPELKRLALAVGAPVLMTKNDKTNRWVNGSLGYVSKIVHGKVQVTFEDGKSFLVEPVKWEIRRLVNYGSIDSPRIYTGLVGWYTQLPIKLGWAVTVHKSQGLTLEAAVLDFDDQYFAAGQAYVALSRVRSLKGLAFVSPVKPEDFIAPSADVTNFYRNAENAPFKKRQLDPKITILITNFIVEQGYDLENFLIKSEPYLRTKRDRFKNRVVYYSELAQKIEGDAKQQKQAKFWIEDVLNSSF